MSFTLKSNVGAINAQLRERASALVRTTAFGIQTKIRVSMAEEKHGRIYRRKGREHQASAPGESPAIDTGALANSTQTEAEGLHATVSTNMEYAPILEFGGAHIAPRPFFGPAFEAAKPEFERGLKELLK